MPPQMSFSGYTPPTAAQTANALTSQTAAQIAMQKSRSRANNELDGVQNFRDGTNGHSAAGRRADDALFRDPKVLEQIKALRAVAINKQIDMTDAFSEYAGTGKDARLGIMAKNRFRSALGSIFQGMNIDPKVLKQICVLYGTGDPDAYEPGTQMGVLWKQFAIDFDEVPLTEIQSASKLDPQLISFLQGLKLAAVNSRLDMTDAFSEVAAPADANLGIMTKNRFRSALGTIFKTTPIPPEVLTRICATYAAGDPDPREPGTCVKVLWKQFAIDFDEIPVLVERKQGSPDAPLVELLRALKKIAVSKRLDLSDSFEAYVPAGARDVNLGVMPKCRFRAAMGQFFTGISDGLLAAICAAYGVGDPDDKEPGTFAKVLWKQFAADFDALTPALEASVGTPDGPARERLIALRGEAGAKLLDLSDALSEYADGDLAAKNLGRMPKSKFCSALGIIFAGSSKLSHQVLLDICRLYGCGDIDRNTRDGTYLYVQWEQFAKDFDELPWSRAAIRGAGGFF